jgi:hypothetical protein
MKFARHEWSHRWRGAVGGGILAACGALISAAPAQAYDDKSTLSSVLELVGVQMGEDVRKVDYNERPRLVLPPNRQGVSEPQAGTAGRRGANWPADPDGDRRRGANRAVGAGAASAGGAPGRDSLIEPPAPYRQATKDISKIRDPEAKESWWNPFSYMRNDDRKTGGKDDSAEGGAISSLRSVMPKFLRGSDND